MVDYRPPGVILAGGRGTRMGGVDKAFLAPGGLPLIKHVVDRLAQQVGALAINASGDLSRFDAYQHPVVADVLTGHLGPLAGVLTAMEWAANLGAQNVVTVAVDTPFFPADLVARLRAAQQGARPVMAATQNSTEVTRCMTKPGVLRHPTCALWPVVLRDDLRRALEKGFAKATRWADAQGCTQVMFETGDLDPFFNINTPEDLDMAEAHLVRDPEAG